VEFGRQKTVKKSTHWHKHGKVKGRAVVAVENNRSKAELERIKKARSEPMYDSVQEAFNAARKDQK
jgi:hypothetical protein